MASSAPAPTYPLATHLVLYNQYKIFKYHSAENRSTCLLNSNFQTDNMTQIDILRCSRPEMFYKNVFLKVVQNSHENICARDFRCIFLNFATFLRTLFLKNTFCGCFCQYLQQLNLDYFHKYLDGMSCFRFTDTLKSLNSGCF